MHEPVNSQPFDNKMCCHASAAKTGEVFSAEFQVCTNVQNERVPAHAGADVLGESLTMPYEYRYSMDSMREMSLLFIYGRIVLYLGAQTKLSSQGIRTPHRTEDLI